jgi:DNA-directed RNA polymerase subunit K/omega
MSKKITKNKINNDTDDNDDIVTNVEESDENILDYNVDDDEDEDYEDYEDIEDANDNTDKYEECQLEKIIEDDDEYFDNFENSEIQGNIKQVMLKGINRISSNRLTKYEMIRILGEREKQLTMGAKPLVKNHELLTYDKVAEEELKLNMIPYKIKRSLPNGKYEIWTLDELYKDHLLSQLE